MRLLPIVGRRLWQALQLKVHVIFTCHKTSPPPIPHLKHIKSVLSSRAVRIWVVGRGPALPVPGSEADVAGPGRERGEVSTAPWAAVTLSGHDSLSVFVF